MRILLVQIDVPHVCIRIRAQAVGALTVTHSLALVEDGGVIAVP